MEALFANLIRWVPMRKFFGLLCTFALLSCLVGCGNAPEPADDTETLILRPEADWEMADGMGAIAEAPYMLKHNGLYYLVYSGSHTHCDHYAVGYLVSNDPLAGFTRYADNPILAATYEKRGPGHCSIVTAPDNETMLILYHVHYSESESNPRQVCVDRIRFAPTESGIDRLECYGPTTGPHPVTWMPEGYTYVPPVNDDGNG